MMNWKENNLTKIPRRYEFIISKWKKWRKEKLPVWAFLIIILICFCAIFAPQISPNDPGLIELTHRLTPPVWQDGGSSSRILGTDAIGRDLLSRIIYGSRISIFVGLMAVLIGGGAGMLIGLIAGYKEGWFDNVVMRIADVQMSVPFILLALIILAILGPGLEKLIMVLALQSWIPYARVVRGETLRLKKLDYVEASRAQGSSDLKIMLRHILPNLLAPNLVLGSFTVAQTIEREAALSFLGLGVGAGIPTWGGILATGRDYITEAWWIAALPGLAIVITVLSINVLGDWLRDYLDPRNVTQK
jgi:peptide/nickel transport system permease protein